MPDRDLWDEREMGVLYEPGSSLAHEHGCCCPRIDNHYGRGRYGDGGKYGWLINGACDLHKGLK